MQVILDIFNFIGEQLLSSYSIVLVWLPGWLAAVEETLPNHC